MENITTLIMVYLAGLGATLIITRSVLFEPVRKYMEQNNTGNTNSRLHAFFTRSRIAYVIQCPQCCGFWVGLLFGALTVNLPISFLYAVYIGFVGFGVSFLSAFFDIVMSVLYGIDTE